MKRLVISAAFAAAIIASAGTAALAADPTPTPIPSMAPMPVPSVSVSLDPNTAEVCSTSRDTVNKGIQSFTDELSKAGTLATNGDLQGAENSVKKSGTILLDL